jgi:hypothetical protein
MNELLITRAFSWRRHLTIETRFVFVPPYKALAERRAWRHAPYDILHNIPACFLTKSSAASGCLVVPIFFIRRERGRTLPKRLYGPAHKVQGRPTPLHHVCAEKERKIEGGLFTDAPAFSSLPPRWPFPLTFRSAQTPIIYISTLHTEIFCSLMEKRPREKCDRCARHSGWIHPPMKARRIQDVRKMWDIHKKSSIKWYLIKN